MPDFVQLSPCRSEPDEQCSNPSDLLDMKKSCLQLSKSAPINCDIVKYQQNFTKSLIETVKDNLSSAVLLVQKIRKVKKKSQDIVDRFDNLYLNFAL